MEIDHINFLIISCTGSETIILFKLNIPSHVRIIDRSMSKLNFFCYHFGVDVSK